MYQALNTNVLVRYLAHFSGKLRRVPPTGVPNPGFATNKSATRATSKNLDEGRQYREKVQNSEI